MAYEKTNWQNTPSTQTPLSASNLNKMEYGIRNNSLNIENLDTAVQTNTTNISTNTTNIGTLTNLTTTAKSNLVSAINEVNGKISNVYSTTETLTNGKWIDNKPIYRKVISTNTPSSTNSWANVGSVSNVDTIINIYGYFKAADGRRISINSPEPSAETATTFLNGNVQMKVIASSWTSKPVNIIVEYTKTS